MKLNQLELDTLTTTQRDALVSPPEGCLIYNTTNGKLEFYTGTAWEPINRTKTGEYTGDGTTSMAVTGIGFAPTTLKIWRRETVDNAATVMLETTTEIMDDNAAGGAVASISTDPEHRFLTDSIISLDADGFTVDDAGTDRDPNTSGVVYNYKASA